MARVLTQTKIRRAGKKAAGNLRRAARNVRTGTALALAAGNVISARTRLPLDAGEMNMMVNEKMSAFGHAGLVFAHHAARASAYAMLGATAEWAALGRHAAALATSRTPFGAAMVYGNSARAWWERRVTGALVVGADMLRAQQEVTAPIKNTVHANARRLRAA